MCNMKTMLKMILGIALLAGIAYVAFPQYQASIASVTPFLLALACPLAMLLMAVGMSRDKESPAAAGGGSQEACCGRKQAPGKPATEGERHA